MPTSDREVVICVRSRSPLTNVLPTKLHAGHLDHPALGDAEDDPRVARLVALDQFDAGIEPALFLELAQDGLLGDAGWRSG